MHRSCFAAFALTLAACNPGGGTPDAGPPDYEAVAPIFMNACAFSSCHGGTGMGAAHLNFQTAIRDGTLRDILVDVPACEYSAMPLVDPGNPDGSWLWIKIAGPHDATNHLMFTPDASWDPGLMTNPDGTYPASVCPFTERGMISFGLVMPQGTGGLDAMRAARIRGWIELGAPGPAAAP